MVCQMDEVDSIHVATERLMGSMGDTPEMVRQARILALVSFSPVLCCVFCCFYTFVTDHIVCLLYDLYSFSLHLFSLGTWPDSV